MQVPNLARQLSPKFNLWLVDQGAEILSPTNDWEVLRYRLNSELHIIYKNKHERLTYTNRSLDHMIEFTEAAQTDLGTRGRTVCRGPNLMTVPKGSNIADIVKGWGSATDSPREPAIHSQEPEGGDQPPADHHTRLPWE